MYLKYDKESLVEALSENYTEAQIERIIKLETNVAMRNHNGIGNFNQTLNQNIWNPLKQGSAPQSLIDSVLPLLQGEIDRVLADK